MLCILTEVNYDGRSYNVKVRGIHANPLLAKFDTGAVATTISLSSLCTDYDSQVDNCLLQHAKKRGLKPVHFTAANGTDVKCYRAYAKNVRVGNIIIPEFHYYVPVGVKRKSFLLGNDFISCCGFSHKCQGNILINSFNAEEYASSFAHGDYLTDEDITEIFEMVEAEEAATESSVF